MSAVLATGWSRHLPSLAVPMLLAIARDTQIDEDGLAARISWEDSAGWQAPAWSQPRPEGTDPARAAAELTSFRRRRARMDAFCQTLGVPLVRTAGELLTFLITVQLVVRGVDGTLAVNPGAPFPEDVIPLSEKGHRIQDSTRWDREVLWAGIEFEGSLKRWIRGRGGEPVSRLPLTVISVAENLRIPVEVVREVLASLTGDGSVEMTTDPALVPADEPFELVVDWEHFDRVRLN